MPTLAENKYFSLHFFPQRPCRLHLSTQNVQASPWEMDIQVFIPAPTMQQLLKQYSVKSSIIGKNTFDRLIVSVKID